VLPFPIGGLWGSRISTKASKHRGYSSGKSKLNFFFNSARKSRFIWS
jgi:hypothetical protein